jgi:hypothetical protein
MDVLDRKTTAGESSSFFSSTANGQSNLSMNNKHLKNNSKKNKEKDKSNLDPLGMNQVNSSMETMKKKYPYTPMPSLWNGGKQSEEGAVAAAVVKDSGNGSKGSSAGNKRKKKKT